MKQPIREAARLALARIARRCHLPIGPGGQVAITAALPASPPRLDPSPDDQVRVALVRYLDAIAAIRGSHDDDEVDRLIAREWTCWEVLRSLLGNPREDAVGLLMVDGKPYLIGVPDDRGATVYARPFDFVRTIGGGR